MLDTKISGIQVKAMSTTLPTEKRIDEQSNVHYVCHELQTTSDLGFDAAERIIASLSVAKEEIGILLFGSKTPDYRSPTTAAVLQGRLGLSIDCICFDTNVGSNGFVKMTQVAAALLSKSNRKYALVIVGDTPSKLSNNSLGALFALSDAATAVLLQSSTADDELLYSTYSTGNHYHGFYLKEGGFRNYNPLLPYDGSKPENYIAKSAIQTSTDFFSSIRHLVVFEKINQLYSSNLVENLQLEDHWKGQRKIKTDASELPLLLENILKENLLSNNEVQFVTVGEGMALMKMQMNHLPKIIPTQHSNESFTDYKVSHEM
jgi:hypothetical protein